MPLLSLKKSKKKRRSRKSLTSKSLFCAILALFLLIRCLIPRLICARENNRTRLFFVAAICCWLLK